MKKFLLSSAIAVTFALFSACGDDSSSGPEEIESSSSVEAEDESSSSVEEEGKSSSSHSGEGAPESSEESGDAKSSSSEAKKGESSSSEEGEESSSSDVIASSSGTTQSIGSEGAWEYLNPDIDYGEFTDKRDGQTYKTVTIGSQTWMAQNLNYDYNKGTAKSYCYEDKADSCAKYGRLYLWSAAMDSAGAFSTSGKGCGYYGNSCSASGTIRGVCPEGWHLPSQYEYDVMINYIDNSYTKGQSGYRYSTSAGQYLKSQSGWSESGNGYDTYGFSALPAGSRYRYGSFDNAGNGAYFWSSSEDYSYLAYYMYLYYGYEPAFLTNDYKYYAFSVRCVQN